MLWVLPSLADAHISNHIGTTKTTICYYHTEQWLFKKDIDLLLAATVVPSLEQFITRTSLPLILLPFNFRANDTASFSWNKNKTLLRLLMSIRSYSLQYLLPLLQFNNNIKTHKLQTFN